MKKLKDNKKQNFDEHKNSSLIYKCAYDLEIPDDLPQFENGITKQHLQIYKMFIRLAPY